MLKEEFRPILLPRRGEALAWLSGLLMVVGWLILRIRELHVPSYVPYVTVFLLLASLSISLGNWMDRRTVIYLDPDGIQFDNGLRHVYLRWEQILQIILITSNWGDKIRIYGTLGHFDFRSLGEVKMSGEVKGRMGFESGDLILKRILQMTGLQEIEHTGKQVYYARK